MHFSKYIKVDDKINNGLNTLTRVHACYDLSPFGWGSVLTNLSQVINGLASQQYLQPKGKVK